MLNLPTTMHSSRFQKLSRYHEDDICCDKTRRHNSRLVQLGRLATDCSQFESSQVLEATSATTTCFRWIRRLQRRKRWSYEALIVLENLRKLELSKPQHPIQQLDIVPMINAPTLETTNKSGLCRCGHGNPFPDATCIHCGNLQEFTITPRVIPSSLFLFLFFASYVSALLKSILCPSVELSFTKRLSQKFVATSDVLKILEMRKS